MAPEIIKEDLYNNKVDIWALGCILYELCTLNICFKAVSLQKVIDKIIAGEPDKININLYGTDFENLINLLIKKDYKQRPNINELYNKLNENDSNDNEKNLNDKINLREKYDSIIERNKNLTFDYINKDYDKKNIVALFKIIEQ
jgi:serine/threonine protein kinase